VIAPTCPLDEFPLVHGHLRDATLRPLSGYGVDWRQTIPCGNILRRRWPTPPAALGRLPPPPCRVPDEGDQNPHAAGAGSSIRRLKPSGMSEVT
jgi:hypothetical protein